MDDTARWPELDGLRAVAVIGVLAVHLQHPGFLTGGYLGVDVFFVLSGFLITWLLLLEIDRSGRISLARFYLRRALRLLPALAAAVTIAVILVYSVGAARSFRHGTLTSLPWTLLYVENWRRALLQPAASVPGVGLLGHAWSLSIEEQFYLLWPLILIAVLLVAKVARRAAAFGTLIAAAVVALYRFGALVGLHWTAQRAYYGTDLHCDGLLLGCSLALSLSLDEARVRATICHHLRLIYLLGVSACAVVVVLFQVSSGNTGRGYWFSIPVTDAASAFLILCVVTGRSGPTGSLLRSRPMRWLGQRSYGIYLYHYLVYFGLYAGLARGAGWSAITDGSLRIVTSIVMAALSFLVVERPALSMKSRLSARRFAPQPECKGPPTRAQVDAS